MNWNKLVMYLAGVAGMDKEAGAGLLKMMAKVPGGAETILAAAGDKRGEMIGSRIAKVLAEIKASLGQRGIQASTDDVIQGLVELRSGLTNSARMPRRWLGVEELLPIVRPQSELAKTMSGIGRSGIDLEVRGDLPRRLARGMRNIRNFQNMAQKPGFKTLVDGGFLK